MEEKYISVAGLSCMLRHASVASLPRADRPDTFHVFMNFAAGINKYTEEWVTNVRSMTAKPTFSTRDDDDVEHQRDNTKHSTTR